VKCIRASSVDGFFSIYLQNDNFTAWVLDTFVYCDLPVTLKTFGTRKLSAYEIVVGGSTIPSIGPSVANQLTQRIVDTTPHYYRKLIALGDPGKGGDAGEQENEITEGDADDADDAGDASTTHTKQLLLGQRALSTTTACGLEPELIAKEEHKQELVVKQAPEANGAVADQDVSEIIEQELGRSSYVQIPNLQQPQEEGDHNGCGVALIQHVYMEAFCRMFDCTGLVLDGRNAYRLNIAVAMRTSRVTALDPRTVHVEEETQLVVGEVFTAKDWSSLDPNQRLSDAVIQFCCKLIAEEHDRLIAHGLIHDGPIYIFDPLFAHSVLASASSRKTTKITKKFIKESIRHASKIIVPVCSSNHYFLLACNPGPCTPSPYSLVFRLHDSCSSHAMNPTRSEIVELISSVLIRSGLPHMLSRTSDVEQEYAHAYARQCDPLHRDSECEEFISDRLNLPTRSPLTPACSRAPSMVTADELLGSIAAASNMKKMPKLQPEHLRETAVVDITYNMSSNLSEVPDFLAELSKNGTFAGEPVIETLSARCDRPVFVLKVPDELGELQPLSVHGRHSSGTPIILFLFNAGTEAAHYGLGILSDLPQFEKELSAALRLVHVEPLSLHLRVGSNVLTIKLFGMQGNGNCLFSCMDLALKSYNPEWQEGGVYYTRYIRRSCLAAAAALRDDAFRMVKDLKINNSTIRNCNNLASTSGSDSHAFDTSLPGAALAREALRQQNGVSLSLAHTVFCDPGSATLAILAVQAHLNPDAVCIGFEQDPSVHGLGMIIHHTLLESGRWRGHMATRNMRAQSAGSYDGITNFSAYDGTCGQVENLDPEHVKFISDVMDTPSVVEFTSTKLGSDALITAYAKASPTFCKRLPEFDVFILEDSPQRSNNLLSWMFIRKLIYRQERTPIHTRRTLVETLISNAYKAAGNSPHNEMYTVSRYGKCIALKKQDVDRTKHKLALGDLIVSCIRTAALFSFGDKVMHNPSETHMTFVGVKVTGKKNEEAVGKTKEAIVEMMVLAVKPNSLNDGHSFWLVSPEDVVPVFPRQKSTNYTNDWTCHQLVVRNGASLIRDYRMAARNVPVKTLTMRKRMLGSPTFNPLQAQKPTSKTKSPAPTICFEGQPEQPSWLLPRSMRRNWRQSSSK
jgi:hypothetical protein